MSVLAKDMKLLMVSLISLAVSRLAMAQELPESGAVIMISPKSPVEYCDDVITHSAEPIFPTSLSAQHEVIRRGACKIELTYRLLESGDVTVVGVNTFEERCWPFVRASEVALLKSTFKKPKVERYCYQVYTYELE